MDEQLRFIDASRRKFPLHHAPAHGGAQAYDAIRVEQPAESDMLSSFPFAPPAMQRFALAPMSPFIRGLTLVVLALPAAFVGSALLGPSVLFWPGIVLIALYAWIWTRFRPTRFVVSPNAIDVYWPLKHRRIARSTIKSVRRVDNAALREIAGAGIRVGAGGLWGGFGWLWTTHRGIAQMYVSRTDGYVWIERGKERPWLITPENPDGFINALRLT